MGGDDPMDKQTFQLRLVQAGYSPDQVVCIERIFCIERILRRCATIPVSMEEIRDAAYHYFAVCRDVDMLPAFLRTVDNLSRGYAIGWTNASAIVVRIVAMWWKP